MGSLFYINVPNREHEIVLRQRDYQIIVSKEVERNARRNTSTLPLLPGNQIVGQQRGSILLQSFDNSENSMMNQTSSEVSNLISNDEHIYEGTSEGGTKVNVIVTKDTMDVLNKDDGLALNTNEIIGIKNNKNPDDLQLETMQNSINRTFLEKHLEDCLKKFVIYDATWGTSIDGNFAQVSFTVNADRSEEIINYMLTLGIGLKFESTLSVCSAIVYYNEKQEIKKKQQQAIEAGGNTGDEVVGRETFGSKFVASIKSRLTVAQVIQSVKNNAMMTFDFIILIIVAGIIAGLGLLENSSVNLVASMLISPLMGPIMAGCFGAVIRDWKLVKVGILSELVGLSICILIGFVFGICVGWHPFDGPWATVKVWPTDEMVARGRKRGMVVGAFIAIPSGAGVALSILGGNAGSLVGVAISASLLPPAVNAGLFWGLAAIISIEQQMNGNNVMLPCNRNGSSKPTIKYPITDYYRTNHVPVACDEVLRDFALMGIASFGLTIVNIILILITGAIVLKIKEVAPHTTRKTMNRFWKEDLKAMRDYNKEHGSFNQQALFNEISNAENSTQLKIKLANDHIYNQVTRRNVFGNGVDILQNANDDYAHGRDLEATGGGNEQSFSNISVHTTHHSRHPHPPHSSPTTGGGFLGMFTSIFHTKPPVESELVSETNTRTNSPFASRKPSTTTRKLGH